MTSPAANSTFRLHLPVRADSDIVSAKLFAAGALGVWESADGSVAWFEQPVDLDSELTHSATWSREPDCDWQAEWKATIGPVVAGRFHIVPSWLAASHVADDPDDVIVLDPGRAFGSGHHATTTMCLELLDDCDRRGGLRGRTVADVGCGSGILAIAAARRGATVTAIDIDADAIEVTACNAAENHVDFATTIHGGLDALSDRYDVVVANLLTDIIAAHAPRLAAATRRTLLVSGITHERRNIAFDALAAAGLHYTSERSRDGWTAAVWTAEEES